MRVLRRLLGGNPEPGPPATSDTAASGAEDLDAEERAYELELLREEQARLSDLAQRQLRYAKDAWQPPAQGGERRAGDRDPRG
jgi:hypothetical protein